MLQRTLQVGHTLGTKYSVIHLIPTSIDSCTIVILGGYFSSVPSDWDGIGYNCEMDPSCNAPAVEFVPVGDSFPTCLCVILFFNLFS